MKIYVDERGNIFDVDSTLDPNLTEIELDDESNPFKDWSMDRICCYRVAVHDGRITMMTPRTDSRTIEFYDRGGRAHNDNSEGIFDVAELAGENSEATYDLAAYIEELVELITNLDERVTALEEKLEEQEAEDNG